MWNNKLRIWIQDTFAYKNDYEHLRNKIYNLEMELETIKKHLKIKIEIQPRTFVVKENK